MFSFRMLPLIDRFFPKRADVPTRVDYRSTGQSVALVFVHGFSGGAGATWSGFAPHLLNDPALETWDVFGLGYASHLRIDVPDIWSADPDLALLANGLRTALQLPPFDRYQRIAIAAHSMGGLVVQRAIADDQKLCGRLSHVFFFGTPSAGLVKARLFGTLKRQIGDMTVDSAFITTLRRNGLCALALGRRSN